MLKKLKLNIASRRIKKESNGKKRSGFWKRVGKIISAPFRAFGRLVRNFWHWLCGIDLIGMINLGLLFAIIVLCSTLILNIIRCNQTPVMIVSSDAPRALIARKAPEQQYKNQAKHAHIIKTNSNPYLVKDYSSDTCPVNPATIQGDVILDNHRQANAVENCSTIQGNLYLQNMRKYTLPCNIHINGNLFLRDINMLQFCGDFTITGNIYVSPRSSFGPIQGKYNV